jgi:hypothetical protein
VLAKLQSSGQTPGLLFVWGGRASTRAFESALNIAHLAILRIHRQF